MYRKLVNAASLACAISILFLLLSVTFSWQNPIAQLLSSFDLWLALVSIGLTVFNLWLNRPQVLPLGALAASVLLITTTRTHGTEAVQRNDVMGVRVLSLNVNQFQNDSVKAALVAEYIAQQDCDLVLLQEFGLYYKWPDVVSMTEAFRNEVDMPYAHFQPHKDNIFGTAIFSKHPIQHSQLIFNQRGDCNEAWQHVIHLPHGELSVINVHLQSYNWSQGLSGSKEKGPLAVARKQLQQIRLIDSVLNVNDQHAVVAGDFNASISSPALQNWHQKLAQPMAKSKWRFMPTYQWLPLQIDQVWIGLNHPARVDVDCGAPSDHAALVVSL